jgi:protoporphyrinogen oxidase
VNSARVAVVGAGLAGLNCAARLAGLGFSPSVYEASDGIGGRARTDSIDGFRLDRGFQVLLTAYPEAQRTFNYASLGLGEFVPGAQVRRGGSFAVFADPTRVPRSAPASLKPPVAGVADLWRLYRMKRDLATSDPRKILGRTDLPALESLRQRGFSDSMIESFFRPFFGGVFIDPDLVTSSRLMEIYFRCFSGGSAALPRGGIGALAAQLADRLPKGTINLNSPVRRVDSDGLDLEDGRRIDAEAVVVATEESSAATLCGLEVSAADRSTTCLYFDAPESEIKGSWLILSPAGEGPINELAIPSSVAEGYAPPGRSLVSVSVVGEQCDRTDLLGATRTQLAAWFGESAVAGWRHLRSYRIEQALPGFDPGRLRVDGLNPRLDSGVFVCGDHRETPSIQGALVSGRKAAAAVAAAGDRTD